MKQMDGERQGRCFDGDSGEEQPGGEAHVFPCVSRWSQFLSVGDGRLAPRGSLYFSIPSHLVRQYHKKGHDHVPYMCLGVYGRGDSDEEPWEVDDDADNDEENDDGLDVDKNIRDNNVSQPDHGDRANRPPEGDPWVPLRDFEDAEIITTQCTNVGAVIEWLFIPFIEEEPSMEETNETNETDPASQEL